MVDVILQCVLFRSSLQVKAGRTMMGCGRQGIAILAEVEASGGEARSKILQPVVLPVLQGKGPCGK